MNKNFINEDDYSRRKGSFFSQILASLRNPPLSGYALIRKTSFIKKVLNKSGIRLYENNLPVLNDTQKKIVDNLIKNGIAVTNLENLFPKQKNLSFMLEAIKLYKEKPSLSASKPFLKYSLGRGSVFDFSNPLNKLSLDPRILKIVNSYLGICTKLRYFELTTANIIRKGDIPMGSQRWHRDPTLYGLCKMFLYLTDVDEESGPFIYVKQSHNRGRLRKIFPQRQFGRHGSYPPDGAVENKISKDDVMECKGRKGTVIFCDTTGLHKGGYAFSKPRTMYSSTYMFGGDIGKRVFKYPLNIKEQIIKLDPISRYALSDD